MNISTILLSFSIVGVFIVVIAFFIYKERVRTARYVEALSSDQRVRLMKTEITMRNAEKSIWTQDAVIMELREGSKKTTVHALYYDRVQHPGSFSPADFSVKTEEVRQRGLAPGSLITILINAEKCSASLQ